MKRKRREAMQMIKTELNDKDLAEKYFTRWKDKVLPNLKRKKKKGKKKKGDKKSQDNDKSKENKNPKKEDKKSKDVKKKKKKK